METFTYEYMQKQEQNNSQIREMNFFPLRGPTPDLRPREGSGVHLTSVARSRRRSRLQLVARTQPRRKTHARTSTWRRSRAVSPDRKRQKPPEEDIAFAQKGGTLQGRPVSTHRRVDGPTLQDVDALTRRRVDASMCPFVDTLTRRRVDASTC